MWMMMAAVLAAEAPAPALPAWMAGCWEQITGESWAEECWTGPRAGLMMGSSRTGKAEALEFYEHMRITTGAEGTSFCALPKGQAGGCFKASNSTAAGIIFENPGHDYPTRIAYRREGDELIAEISGPNGSNPQNWRYRRMKMGD